MNVQEILTRKGTEVSTVRADSTVSTVVNLLKLNGIGALIVSDDGQSVEGIISERDIVRGLVDHGEELLKARVSELMTRNVRTCEPGASITDVMAEMTRSRFRHLPVVENGKLLGIISIGDVVKHRLDELQMETNVLRDYIVGRG